MDKCFILMTEENIYGRTLVKQLLINNVDITGILIEKSPFADRCKKYLENNFYNPSTIPEMIADWEIPIYYTTNHNKQENVDIITKQDDAIIVLGGTRIIKEKIIDAAAVEILNSHPGILPNYRGEDVVAWAILNRDDVCATCHIVTPVVDGGPILMQKKLSYNHGDKLIDIRIGNMILCAELMVECIKQYATINPRYQMFAMPRYKKMPEEKIQQVEEKLKCKINTQQQ